MHKHIDGLLKRVLVSAVVLLLAGAALYAQQETASIRGTVTDPSGASVAKAQVVAIQVETGFIRQAETDSQGDFLLVLLPIGHYRLEASASGFKKYVQEGITLSVNQVAPVPVQLAVGSTQQTIDVKADATLVQTTNDLGETVHERDILDLPLNGRNFSQLGLLQPGAAPLTTGFEDAGGALRSGQTYAVNGLRPESNEFLIDGVENFDFADGGFVFKPPIDAITEFRILTNTASAEFGHAAGSNTNIVTRSGSNRVHGDVYDFFRNDALDSRNFFSQSVDPLKQNQFGGTLGGPIRKDKSFFFGYYEGFRNREGETQLATVPTLAERGGDYSSLCSTYNAQGICTATGGEQLTNAFTGQDYAGNIIPSSALNPVSQNLLKYFPLPNLPAYGPNVYDATQVMTNTSDQFGVRVDHYLSNRDSVFVRYLFSGVSQIDPLSVSGASLPGFPVGENTRAQNAALQEAHTFSPTLVNIARVSFLRDKFLFNESVNHTPPSSAGFTFVPSIPSDLGIPFISVAGYATIGNPQSQRDSYQNTYSATDSLEWTRGRHDLQFGGEYRRDQVNAIVPVAPNGYFIFAPTPINDAFASFLIGEPEVFLQAGGDLERGLRENSFAFYAQDSYKATSRLTLNVGLRYELPFPLTEIRNRMMFFRPGLQSTVMPSAPKGLLYPGDPGVPRGMIQSDLRGYAPRFGLSWDPTGSHRWAIRTAYGIFHDPFYNGPSGPIKDEDTAQPWFTNVSTSFPANFANPLASTSGIEPGYNYPMNANSLDPNIRLPYAQDWNFTVERSFGGNWLLDVGYVGTKGTKLPRFYEADPAVYVPGESTEQNVDQRRIYSGCTLGEPSSDCVYNSMGNIATIANSNYSGLQASLRKRLSQGLTFLGSYTYSKTLDDVSSLNIGSSTTHGVAGENDLAEDPFNLEAEYGRSLFDARQRFVFSYEWQIPSPQGLQGWRKLALADWQMNGIFSASSGTPFTIYDSQDVSLQGTSPEDSSASSNRPDLIGNPNNGPKTPQEWFNTSAFQRLNPVTQAGQFGNAGRNIVQAAGLAQLDYSLFKNFRIGESKTIELRGEFFNILNRVNWGVPNNDISSSTFGVVQNANSPRQIQLGLKLIF